MKEDFVSYRAGMGWRRDFWSNPVYLRELSCTQFADRTFV